jgi:6-phosphogluconate dehydrogenase
VEMTGNPAITIYGDTVDIVLPTATVYREYEEGLTTQDILDAFLDRYGQRCSGRWTSTFPIQI